MLLRCVLMCGQPVNTLRLRQNRHHFADDIFRCIFVNGKFCILIKILLKFVPKGSMDNKPALVQIMAWCGLGHKPLSEPVYVYIYIYIYVTKLFSI